MGVLTSEEAGMRAPEPEKKEAKKREPKKASASIASFLFVPADGQDCMASFFDKDGNEHSIELKKGRVSINLKKEGGEEMAARLEAAGFVSISTENAPAPEEEVAPTVFVMMHPDSTPENPINGLYKYDEAHSFEVMDGIARTDAEGMEILQAQGFVFVKAEEK